MESEITHFLAHTGRELALGLLAGINIYSISRLYYWRRAKIHYLVALIAGVAYTLAVTVFKNDELRDVFLFAVLMFSVFYAWRRLRIIMAFEHRTGIRVRQTKFSELELANGHGNVAPYEDTLTGGEETAKQKSDRKDYEAQ